MHRVRSMRKKMSVSREDNKWNETCGQQIRILIIILNKMNKLISALILGAISISGCAKSGENKTTHMNQSTQQSDTSTVYMTHEISPEAIIKLYKALGREAKGKVAIKISTGEPGGHNFLQPALIGDFVKLTNGTIVECNTLMKDGAHYRRTPQSC